MATSVCRALFESIRPGTWKQINDIAYTDGAITVVHTEHFASQGALLPNWLSGDGHERGRLGILAREAVERARICLAKTEEPICQPMERTLPAINEANEQLTSKAFEPQGEHVPAPVLDTASSRIAEGHAITLTEGAIRNGNLSLNSVRHVIPVGGVGGTNKKELGRPFTIRFDPGSLVETDVAGDKMTLRCRSAVREFFKKVDAKHGDQVRVRAEGPRMIVITHQRK